MNYYPRLKLFSFITAEILTMLTVNAGNGNIIYNPGFEKLDDWKNGGGKNTTYQISSEEKHSGKFSYHMNVCSPEWCGVISKQRQVQPNTNYSFSYWGKGKNITGKRGFNVHLRELDKNGKILKSHSKSEVLIDDFCLIKGGSDDKKRTDIASSFRKFPNGIIFKNDKGFCINSRCTTFQGFTKEVVKKIIYMPELSDAIIAQFPNAAISIYGYCADNKNNGINESLDLKVNGIVNRFKINKNFKPGFENIQWCDFQIPIRQFKAGENIILINKSSGTHDDDDYFYVGINGQQNGFSSYSENKGISWKNYLNPLGKKGEYMIRVKLFDKNNKNATATVADFNLQPPVKTIKSATPTAPKCVITPKLITLENAYVKLALSTEFKKLKLLNLEHKALKKTPLNKNKLNQFFKIKKNNRELNLQDFTIENIQHNQKNSTERIVFFLKKSRGNAQLIAELYIEMDKTPEVKLGLKIKNISREPAEIIVVFPLLQGIKWDKNINNDYYFSPAKGGIISMRPRANVGQYGGSAFFQVVASYCPRAGGGLSIFIKDRKGIYKIFACIKNAISVLLNGQSFYGRIEDKLTNNFLDYLHSEFLSDAPGTSMSVAWQPAALSPGQTWTAANAVVDAFIGDWHTPMKKYTDWFKERSFKQRKPGRLDGIFNISGCWLTETSYKQPVSPRLQMPELYAWWEWEKASPKFYADNQKLATKVQRRWEPGKGYNRKENGTLYYFGNNGDYGSEGYNEKWGGLPALRKYISSLQQSKHTVMMYIAGVSLDVASKMGKQYGEKWGVIGPDDKYLWIYETWDMCPDNPLWRQHLIDATLDVLKKTGCNGVRFDEIGAHGSICKSQKHPHTFNKNGEFTWFRAQAELCKNTRKAIDRAVPEAYFMTEVMGYDHLAQYIDGCLSYRMPQNPSSIELYINIPRFYFPECKQFEYYYKYTPTVEKRLVFNGMGWSGVRYPMSTLHMMTENADAFDSLELKALIETFIPQVYANYFKSPVKTVYTVYNVSKNKQEGYVLEVPLSKNQHVFDIYRQKEIKFKRKDSDKALIYLALGAGDLACPTIFENLLSIEKKNQKIIVKNNSAVKGTKIWISDYSNRKLFQTEEKYLEVPHSILEKSNALCAKLMKDDKLIDIIKIK